MAEPIVVVDYDPDWPKVFEELRASVSAALGSLAVAIEHVGSTAVPGLPAKPIIDLDVVIPTAADLPAAVERLATIGYVHRGDLGIRGREAFKPPSGTPRHHLYVCTSDSTECRRHLLFRDYLRTHSEETRAYGELKRLAARRVGDDRIAYVEAKDAFVASILEHAARSAERAASEQPHLSGGRSAS